MENFKGRIIVVELMTEKEKCWPGSCTMPIMIHNFWQRGTVQRIYLMGQDSSSCLVCVTHINGSACIGHWLADSIISVLGPI